MPKRKRKPGELFLIKSKLSETDKLILLHAKRARMLSKKLSRELKQASLNY